MPTAYRQRTIDGPDSEWLNVEKAAAYLELSVTEFTDRVTLGVVPPGSSSNLRESQWHWQAIQGISWNRAWHDAIYVERRKAKNEQRRGKRAHGGDTTLDT